MARNDIKDSSKPKGTGQIVLTTKFIGTNGLVLKTIQNKIISRVEDKDICKHTPENPKLVKINGDVYKISDIVDRSEGYRLTREIVVTKASEKELKQSKPEIKI